MHLWQAADGPSAAELAEVMIEVLVDQPSPVLPAHPSEEAMEALVGGCGTPIAESRQRPEDSALLLEELSFVRDDAVRVGGCVALEGPLTKD